MVIISVHQKSLVEPTYLENILETRRSVIIAHPKRSELILPRVLFLVATGHHDDIFVSCAGVASSLSQRSGQATTVRIIGHNENSSCCAIGQICQYFLNCVLLVFAGLKKLSFFCQVDQNRILADFGFRCT